MSKKIILITGATNGIGKAAAFELAKEYNKVIIHGRNEELTKATQKEILSQFPYADVDYIIADLFSLEDIKRMAANFKSRYDHLDVLVNNAGGLMKKERATTIDGIEKTIALNLLAPYLLTTLLLDVLQKSQNARIVVTASDAYKSLAKPDLKDIELKNNYTVNASYGNAKLYLMITLQKMNDVLQKRFSGKITLNYFHPGTIASKQFMDYMKDMGTIGKLMLPITPLFAKKPEKGAETLIYLATSQEVDRVSGKYFINNNISAIDSKHFSDEAKNIIWEYCQDKTGVLF